MGMLRPFALSDEVETESPPLLNPRRAATHAHGPKYLLLAAASRRFGGGDVAGRDVAAQRAQVIAMGRPQVAPRQEVLANSTALLVISVGSSWR